MKLKDILAISGKPGLYKFISQGRNGIIVEGFADKKRMVVHSTTKVSALEDIAIFTETDEVSLKDIFKKLFEKEEGKATITHKSSNEDLKVLFEEILPDYDKERVYVSDIKKVISWYNLLIEYELLDPNEEDEDEKDDAGEKKESEQKKTTTETKSGVKSEKKPATKNSGPKTTTKASSTAKPKKPSAK